MLPTFVIGLREGVEAALIVGIVAAFLSRHGRNDALRWVWAGVAAAVALCLAAGIGLHLLEEALPQKQQEGLETVIALFAVCTITYMIFWMRRNSRGLRQELEGAASDALARNSAMALVTMAFLAVFREGLETAVFTLAVFDSSSNRTSAAIGVVLGLLAAVMLGYALYRGGVRINLSRFFRVTGIVLVFVAAGLVASAIHTSHEAGWFNSLQHQALDLTSIVAPGTVRAALLTGMLGLQPKPTVGETLGWLLFAVPLTLYVAWPARRKTGAGNSNSGRLRKAGAVNTVLAIVFLLAACGGGDSDSSNAKTVNVKLTDAGCDPAALNLDAGPTTFNVTNSGANAVTEFEVLDGSRILGEVENVAPGLSGKFTLNLAAGEYVTYCPNGKTAERGTLSVTGELSTATSADLDAGVEQYHAYLKTQSALLVERTTAFVAAIKAGDAEAAEAQFAATREPYEAIEPVAESFGDLDPAIDARDGDVPPESWTGFHRIEKALWEDGSLDGMDVVAGKLLTDVKALQTKIETVQLDAPMIANGSVELLNEVSKSKITGEEDRYSHTDLSDFNANVQGANAAFTALESLLRAHDPALADSIAGQFAAMETALSQYKSGDGWVTYDTLSADDTRALSQAVDALAEPLSHVAETIVAPVSG